jgi:hypothetical protein
MDQMFNISMWFELFRRLAPAEATRAFFREWNDTHKKNR